MQKKTKQKRIYLDHAAITPIENSVSLLMRKVEKDLWANPSSLHLEGEISKKALEDSRIEVARILHCKRSEIFFTSGGTEGLNIAIQGVVKKALEEIKTPHVIVSSIEHPAVLEPLKDLVKDKSIELSFINPDEDGIINPNSIKKEIKQNTILVVLMHSNNEIGTIQPVRKISNIIKEFKQGLGGSLGYPYLLVDASQSPVYEDVSIEKLGADLLVLDGIKMYGPRGVGVLAKRSYVKIKPITFGGGQESGLRAGTENVVGVVGFAEALKIAEKGREKESKRIKKIRDYAVEKILKEIPNSSLNGSLENRLPNNINICFPGQDSEFLVIKLDTLGFAVSAASACNTLSLENSSYVIESLGKTHSTSSGQVGCASSSLRFTLGRSTQKSDMDKLISVLKKIIV